MGDVHVPLIPEPLASEEMTLREYFAGQALAGFCSSQETLQIAHQSGEGQGSQTRQVIAGAAYDMADAMLAERSK